MNNQMQVFNNLEFGALNVLMIGSKAYFPATECARILGYANPQKAIRDHCKGVNESVTPSAGGLQKMKFIPEGDLYRLIIRSNLPAAERFERWVFDEVLPAVRKHGVYATEDVVQMTLKDPAYIIRLLSEFQKEQEAHMATAALLEEKTVQLDESKEWFTVKRVASLNGIDWKQISWKNLKNTSAYLGIPMKKVFDANYGNVNAYHIDVWKHEYGGFFYGEL